MKNTPAGWPRITPSVYYQDPRAAIDWLCRAFGFEVRLKVEGEGGRIEHSELQFADGLIMVGTADGGAPGKEAWQKLYASPKSLGGKGTQGLAVFVDDADAHCARARAAGAEIVREPRTDDYGDDYWADRTYGCLDPEGHLWWFMQRMREPKGHAK
jgi:uncharacterized glyoxalase superfamily protein PhnB